MSDRLITAFDDAVQALEAGASLEAVLARYPELAEDLRPMLQAVQAARPAAPLRVPQQSEAASLKKLLGRARDLRQTERRARTGWRGWTLALRLGGLAVVLAMSGLGVISASAGSLPGEALYGVKRVVETAQLALAFSPAARAELEQQFDARRLTEARAVVAAGRAAPVTFIGRVETQTAERWQIAGLQVVVAPAAVIGVAPAPGQLARVTGEARVDGLIFASRVEAIGPAGATPTAAPNTPATPTALATSATTNTAPAPGAVTSTPTGTAPTAGVPTSTTPTPSRTAPTPTATVTVSAATATVAAPTAGVTATPPPPTPAPSETPDDDDNGNGNGGGDDDNGNGNGNGSGNGNGGDDDDDTPTPTP